MSQHGIEELDHILLLSKATLIPGKMIFAKLWGSYSHNTQKPESDKDFLAVYARPPQELLSLHPGPDTLSQGEGEKPDYQAHEVGKFAQLLAKGNPGVVECLFTNRFYTATEEWEELLLHKKKFLTQVAVKQYLGYAQGQLRRLLKHAGTAGLHTKGGQYNEKWAYHAIRLMGDCERIARGEEPVVWKEGEERDFLMKVRGGQYAMSSVAKHIERQIEKVDALKPWKIPEHPPFVLLNTWLLWVRGLGEKPERKETE